MKEMNCKQIEKDIVFYVDNELSPEKTSLIVSHIAECKYCESLYHHIKSTLQVINAEKILQDDVYFYTRLQQRMENRQKQHWFFNLFPLRIIQPIAIICLLAFGIFTGIKIGNQYNTTNVNLTSEESRISQLNAYSEETYMAEISNENMESLFTSN